MIIVVVLVNMLFIMEVPNRKDDIILDYLRIKPVSIIKSFSQKLDYH